MVQEGRGGGKPGEGREDGATRASPARQQMSSAAGRRDPPLDTSGDGALSISELPHPALPYPGGAADLAGKAGAWRRFELSGPLRQLGNCMQTKGISAQPNSVRAENALE